MRNLSNRPTRRGSSCLEDTMGLALALSVIAAVVWGYGGGCVDLGRYVKYGRDPEPPDFGERMEKCHKLAEETGDSELCSLYRETVKAWNKCFLLRQDGEADSDEYEEALWEFRKNFAAMEAGFSEYRERRRSERKEVNGLTKGD